MSFKKWISKNKIEFIILTVILLFALFLRLYSLGSAPLWVDESISANTAKAILEKGIPEFDSGFIDARAYTFHYIQAFFLLFGINDFAVRLVSVLFGLLTILLAYFIEKEYSKSGGLIATAFTALFYLEVFYSRQARMYQMFQFFFFLTLYLLYKSKEKPILLVPTIISFFITYDTHLAGLILAPFIIIHILIYNRKYWYSAIFPVIPLINNLGISSISSGSSSAAINYASTYFSYTYSIVYLLVLAVIGLIWAFTKDKRLTSFLILPSIVLLIGIFSLQVFAFRYAYFFVFPLILFSAVLFGFLYDKYGKLMLIPIIILILVPSNLFYQQTYVNVIKPIDYNYNDFSAPEINYKILPSNLTNELKNSTIMTFFSPEVEWYLKNPDYVFPFSLDGRGEDQVSRNSTDGRIVDIYSGALISTSKPNGSFYFLADYFGASKLKTGQREQFNSIIANCTISYENSDLRVYSCL